MFKKIFFKIRGKFFLISPNCFCIKKKKKKKSPPRYIDSLLSGCLATFDVC